MTDEKKHCHQCTHVEVCKHVDAVAELTKQMARTGAFDFNIHPTMLDAAAERCLWFAKDDVANTEKET